MTQKKHIIQTNFIEKKFVLHIWDIDAFDYGSIIYNFEKYISILI